MAYFQYTSVFELPHDTLHQRRLSLAVLADEGNFVASFERESGVVEHLMVTECFTDIVDNERIIARARSGWEAEVEMGGVDFVDLDALDFGKLLYAALNLDAFCGLITEAFDEFLGVLNHLLLVGVGALLLFEAFFAQFEELRIVDCVVVDVSERNLDGAVGDIVDKSTIVTDKDNGLGFRHQEIFEPLDRLDVEMVRRLVEQKHVGVAQQKLGELDAHSPSAGELRGGAVEVGAQESEAGESALHFGLVVLAFFHRYALREGRDLVDQLGVGLRFVVGSFGQPGIHIVEAAVHVGYMAECLANLVGERRRVGDLHLLGEVADCSVIGNRYSSRSRVLEPGDDLQHC